MRLYTGMLALVGAASLGLLALNFFTYPPANGRDELAHLRVIEFYSEAHRSPVLPDDLARAWEEGHQPPLFYVPLAALVELGLPVPKTDAYDENPFVIIGNYRADIPPYNRALYVHHWAGMCDYVSTDPAPRPHVPFGESEAQPELDTTCGESSYVWTLYAVRAICVLINLGAVGFVALTIRKMFPDDARPVTVLALAILILTPSFWRTAMVVNNNHLVFLFAAMSLWLLARILREGLRWRLSAALGVVLGLGMLSKVFFAPMVVVVGVFLLQLPLSKVERGLGGEVSGGRRSAVSLHDFSKWASLKHLSLIALMTLLIAGWWYARNVYLYDDPTASNVTEQILESRRETPLSIGEIGEIIAGWPGELWLESWTVLNTRLSFWLASGVGSALMVSGVMAALRKRMSLVNGGGFLLIGAFVLALMVAVVGAARNLHAHYSPPLMLFALPATTILLTIGALGWIPHRLRGRAAMTGVFGILAGTMIFHATSFSPLFPPLDHADSIDDFDVAHRVDVTFQNGARLLGYEIDDRVLQPGQQARVRLCWGADVPMNQLFAVTTQLLLPDGTKAAQQDGYPLSGRYPTTAWQPGTVFCEWIPLQVREDALTPRAYDLRVGMYVYRGEDVPYISESGSPQTVLLLDEVVIVSPDDIVSDAAVVASVDEWGALARIDFSETDGQLDVTWLARDASPGRYQYFLHALDADGDILAQLDRAPLLPTDLWPEGLTFSEQLRLTLPPETARVNFGVYDPVTGRRGVWTMDGAVVGDALTLY